ncbi:MAG: hypothetical protein EVJ47_01200 [Candidatus Acidulodesulfobacterium ferriphilum]|jgi:hypothetical protein|uniref:Uncharacterized protein n=1 Tax=Candidatus Acidulodesulfobacterium ferriphilum TaxID=2597223 RepID=A0A519BCH5_9DELT|nr:MAG: hypothetical protein EVJ47_01200 [Candidatus Acidulodesulfobacterium ferriphilum]
MENIQKFSFLNKLDSLLPESFGDIANIKRFHKYLFGEFILNENSVREAQAFINIPIIKESLERAATYYYAFRYIFYDNKYYGGRPNKELEKLVENGIVKLKTPGTVKLREFKENRIVWTKVLHEIPLKELKNS